jgi:DNA modification methylase
VPLPINQIVRGDALTVLRSWPAESVQCVVTSPPYWGLRDYGVPGQLGLERRPTEYIDRLVEILREVRRVLREDGTLWLNMGDCYQDKQLQGMPWGVAFSLQVDGWVLRQDNIWEKSNPMPESIRDRTTRVHEYIFHFSKSARYFYDQDATKEPASPLTGLRISQSTLARQQGGQKQDLYQQGAPGQNRPDRKPIDILKSVAKKANVGPKAEQVDMDDPVGRPRSNPSFSAAVAGPTIDRNKRSVWKIPIQPVSDAHFATFPEALVQPCIAAGTKEGDVVLDPFMGSGTVALVALKMGRRFVGVELNPDYIKIAEDRIAPELAQGRLL